MDPTRELIIATCASLARLLLRMQEKLHSARYPSRGPIERYPHWSTTDLQPPSPWLDGMGSMALSAGIRNVTLVQACLLAMAAQPGEVDPFKACLVLQRLSSSRHDWSQPVQRMAARLGVTLPPASTVIHDFGGLREEDIPRIPRP